jgi:hypothetical protein
VHPLTENYRGELCSPAKVKNENTTHRAMAENLKILASIFDDIESICQVLLSILYLRMPMGEIVSCGPIFPFMPAWFIFECIVRS